MRESRNDRTRHEDLGQRIEPASTWADILVGEQQLRALRELAVSAAHILQISEDRKSQIKNLTDRGKTVAKPSLWCGCQMVRQKQSSTRP
jgi:hypothetical protein